MKCKYTLIIRFDTRDKFSNMMLNKCNVKLHSTKSQLCMILKSNHTSYLIMCHKSVLSQNDHLLYLCL